MASLFEQQIEEGTCLGLNLDYERPKYDNSIVTSPYEAASLVTRVVNYINSTNELLTPSAKKVVVEGLLNVSAILTGDSSSANDANKEKDTECTGKSRESITVVDSSSSPPVSTESSQETSVQQSISNNEFAPVIHHYDVERSTELDKNIERLEHHFRFHKQIYEELIDLQLDYLDKIKERISRFKSFNDLVKFLIVYIEKDNGFFREKDFLFIVLVYILKHSENYLHLLYYAPLGTKYDIQSGDDDRLKAYDDLMRKIDEATNK